MRRWLPIALAVLFSAGTLLHADDLVYSRFSDYLDSLRTQTGIPGLAAAIVGVGDVQWERVYGQADVDHNIATSIDTPFHLDGLTQLVTASIALRCVADGRLSLDDRFSGATVRELLSHTSPGAGGPVFSYNLERLNALAEPIAACTGDSFFSQVAEFLGRNGMIDSAPGPQALEMPGMNWTQATRIRYQSVLEHLATPYAVDSRGRATPSQYPVRTLTPGAGLIGSAHDLEQFDLALKRGQLLPTDILGTAWTPPVDASGARLPHGLGWFVQSYNGERIVWQFGVSDNASSSLILTIPGRGLTLILVANSQGLTRPFPLAAGDITASPFARLFLSVFVR